MYSTGRIPLQLPAVAASGTAADTLAANIAPVSECLHVFDVHAVQGLLARVSAARLALSLFLSAQKPAINTFPASAAFCALPLYN